LDNLERGVSVGVSVEQGQGEHGNGIKRKKRWLTKSKIGEKYRKNGPSTYLLKWGKA